ncbi:P2 family phage major capsid protein [Mannheimia sp. AT1]|uniref:P2 family phage major capsid protein n=1 Tax=Mannheimia cairinae TaxID=3025936 RepID=A0ABT5MLP1_9PAST|nr:P2 family phage major capsid protein [Mannheimia cairinae]MDD0823096.1 P2 family phage major capsid protein [Mannheimia cairinae]MDD0825879.1 P2 family phage major capsid protein [Mannheimia cairinae]
MSLVTFANALKLDTQGNIVLFDDNPAEQTKLLNRLKQNRLFKLLNLVQTRYPQGEAIGLFTPIAGTTNTDVAERSPKHALAPAQKYDCEQVNIDSYIRYEKMDAYNLENSLEERLNHLLDDNLLRGLLMLGWQGVSRTSTSNPQLNPLAQDVKKGWLQKIREGKPQAVINGASVGEGQTFKNINSLIKQGLSKISPAYSTGGDMIAICGRNIIGEEIIQFEHTDLSENLADLLTLCQKTKGGLKAVSIPYFPSNAILITRLDNLSLYVHLNNIRRRVIDEPRKDSVQTFYSLNIDYIVEDFNACCLIENIEIIEE